MAMKPTGSPNPFSIPAFSLQDRLLARLSGSEAAQPVSGEPRSGATESPAPGVEQIVPRRTPPPAPLADTVVNGCTAAESWIKQEVDYATRGNSPFNQLKQQIHQFRLGCAADYMQRYIDDIESRGSPYDPNAHFILGVDSNSWLVGDEPARLKAVGYSGYSSDDLRGGLYSAAE
jgi:hypothetical protein